MTFPRNKVPLCSCKKNVVSSESSNKLKIYLIGTQFCVDFLNLSVLQSSPTEIPLNCPALRNNKSPHVGQARAVVDDDYTTLPHTLLMFGRRRVITARVDDTLSSKSIYKQSTCDYKIVHNYFF